jgi:hypothetical protein
MTDQSAPPDDETGPVQYSTVDGEVAVIRMNRPE